jgi:hypothetical protein
MIFVNCSVLRPARRILSAFAIGIVGGFIWIIYYILINWFIGRVVTYALGTNVVNGVLNNIARGA